MPNYDPNSDDYHYPPRHEPDPGAEIDHLRAELRDWQESSEAYRHDAEKAETERVVLREALKAMVDWWEPDTTEGLDRLMWENAREALNPSPAGEKADIAELERHLENAGIYGNAGRYWEGRWRDDYARAERAEARVVELEGEIKAIADALEIHEDHDLVGQIKDIELDYMNIKAERDRLMNEKREYFTIAEAERDAMRIAELNRDIAAKAHNLTYLNARAERAEAERDAEMERVKACEHIADGDDGWEKVRYLCPSTAAVARLRDRYAAKVAEAKAGNA